MTLEEQFARLIKTLQLIESEPRKWDASSLELEFGVGRATVERDIRILRQWGTIERRNGFFAVKGMKFLPTSFTASEALAIVLAGSMAVERIGMPPMEAMQNALKKIDSLLPERVETMIRKMRKRVNIGVNLVRECNSETLDGLSRAISGHNPVTINYYVFSRSELTNRTVDPFGLTFRFGAWYMIGHCHMRGEVRTFAVDRIRSLKVLPDHFKYPKDFDLEEYLEKGWSLQADARQEKVILRFHKDVSEWVAGSKFHPHQRVVPQSDGSAIFEVAVAGTDEIKHWVLGFGDKVEVLQPASLRKAISEAAFNMARAYAVPMAVTKEMPAHPMLVHESRGEYRTED
ncbi:MAG: helix-turn-helix transcriptional regulator [Armatimonadota bacterium]